MQLTSFSASQKVLTQSRAQKKVYGNLKAAIGKLGFWGHFCLAQKFLGVLNCSSLSICIYLKCSGRWAMAGLWFIWAWDLALSPKSWNTCSWDLRSKGPPRPLLASYLCSGLAVALGAPKWPLCLCLVTQSCLILWPHGLKPTGLLCPWGFSRQEHRSGLPFPSSGDLPNPGIKPRFPTWQADSLLTQPLGESKKTRVGSLSLLQGIFLTQESNQGLLHCRWILYQLSDQGSMWP